MMSDMTGSKRCGRSPLHAAKRFDRENRIPIIDVTRKMVDQLRRDPSDQILLGRKQVASGQI